MSDSKKPESASADPIVAANTEPTDTSAENRRARGVRALLIGARAATGLAGIAIAIVTIGAATLLPIPTAVLEPAAVTVTPVPAALQVVCPGALLRLGDESGANAASASVLGSPRQTTAATSGAPTAVSLETPDVGGGSADSAPQLLTVPAVDDAESIAIAGAQSQTAKAADYSGFAAADCAVPSSDTWLVGGSTAVGRTTLLTIANPGAATTTVTVELFGEEGAIDAPGTSSIVVGAQSQRVLSLAGFAPDVTSLVVHLTSKGGPVVANLQQSVVRGIDPGGIDLVGATASPLETQVIPGLTVFGTEDAGSLLGLEGYDDLSTELRAFVPGEKPATVTVNVVPEGDAGAGASFDLVVPAGVVTDVPVEGLVDGTYSVTIESTVPLVAAMRASSVSGEDTDFAWFGSATAIDGDAFIAIARGETATIVLSNPGDASATVSLSGGDTVTVSAGGTVSVPVASGSTVALSGADGLYVAVSFVGAGALASYLPGAAATQQSAVTIYP